MWRITSTTLSLGWLIGQTYAASNSTSPSNTTSSNLCVDDTGKGFLLVSTDSPTIVYTDPSSPGAVHHAAASFAQDLGKVVSGSNVQVKNASSLAEVGSANDGTVVVFFGGLDSSSLINQAINATGVNFSGTRDQWEAWSIQTGSLGNGAQDVVIMAGADRVSLIVSVIPAMTERYRNYSGGPHTLPILYRKRWGSHLGTGKISDQIDLYYKMLIP
jgi:hypothetical protein